MTDDVVLSPCIDEHTIAVAVGRLANEILADLPAEQDLLLVVVLHGARRFGEDLAQALWRAPARKGRRIESTTIRASSYRGGTSSSGRVDILEPLQVSLRARHVLIVDDILDQGHTLEVLSAYLSSHEPASLRRCVLLAKPPPAGRLRIEAEYIGMSVPPIFLVGYGLDYQERFRELPYLATIGEGHCVATQRESA